MCEKAKEEGKGKLRREEKDRTESVLMGIIGDSTAMLY
jgi:hypothetical protein